MQKEKEEAYQKVEDSKGEQNKEKKVTGVM